MTAGHAITFKPAFLTGLLQLPPKEKAQIEKKLLLLAADPTPDAKVKKRLKATDGKVYRLRSGDWRILYTFDERYVSLLDLRLRTDATYDGIPAEQQLGGLGASLDPDGDALAVPGDTDLDDAHGSNGAAHAGNPRGPHGALHPGFDDLVAAPPGAATPLPCELTPELLARLRVPDVYFDRLAQVTTQDGLLDCAGIPDDILLRIDEALFAKPIHELLRQPDYVAHNGVDDLLAFREGRLEHFLLRLSPRQQQFVGWALDARGPTLLKGGPGTGKSTVALYRVRAMRDALLAAGVEHPRVLFTTYTNALVNYSRHLLQALLGDAADDVEIRTADSLVMQITGGTLDCSFADRPWLRAALADARKNVEFPGNRLQQRAMTRTVERLSDDYLTDEILGLIEARGLTTLDAYLASPRPGRRVPLNRTQRTAVWLVRDHLVAALTRDARITWPQLRAEAARRVGARHGEQASPGEIGGTASDGAQAGPGDDGASTGAAGTIPEPYDAVLIDEAQDLDPAALRMLVALCRQPNRLFLTADANQSIYGAGFRWSDVHADLRFIGRTGVLRANHRSTRELAEAAWSYLADGALDPDDLDDRQHVHSGPPPAVRAVASPDDEAALLARFLPGAARAFRLGLSACAVLCPSKAAGQPLADRLRAHGLDATDTTSANLDLARPGIKLLPLRAAKGLEVPIVALAGFQTTRYPHLPRGLDPNERQERLTLERRTLFVAMTRAMRALLVVVPVGGHELLGGFDARFWNAGAGGQSR